MIPSKLICEALFERVSEAVVEERWLTWRLSRLPEWQWTFDTHFRPGRASALRRLMAAAGAPEDFVIGAVKYFFFPPSGAAAGRDGSVVRGGGGAEEAQGTSRRAQKRSQTLKRGPSGQAAGGGSSFRGGAGGGSSRGGGGGTSFRGGASAAGGGSSRRRSGDGVVGGGSMSAAAMSAAAGGAAGSAPPSSQRESLDLAAPMSPSSKVLTRTGTGVVKSTTPRKKKSVSKSPRNVTPPSEQVAAAAAEAGLAPVVVTRAPSKSPRRMRTAAGAAEAPSLSDALSAGGTGTPKAAAGAGGSSRSAGKQQQQRGSDSGPGAAFEAKKRSSDSVKKKAAAPGADESLEDSGAESRVSRGELLITVGESPTPRGPRSGAQLQTAASGGGSERAGGNASAAGATAGGSERARSDRKTSRLGAALFGGGASGRGDLPLLSAWHQGGARQQHDPESGPVDPDELTRSLELAEQRKTGASSTAGYAASWWDRLTAAGNSRPRQLRGTDADAASSATAGGGGDTAGGRFVHELYGEADPGIERAFESNVEVGTEQRRTVALALVLIYATWVILLWYAFTFGILIYNLLGKDAEVRRSWVLSGLDECRCCCIAGRKPFRASAGLICARSRLTVWCASLLVCCRRASPRTGLSASRWRCAAAEATKAAYLHAFALCFHGSIQLHLTASLTSGVLFAPLQNASQWKEVILRSLEFVLVFMILDRSTVFGISTWCAAGRRRR